MLKSFFKTIFLHSFILSLIVKLEFGNQDNQLFLINFCSPFSAYQSPPTYGPTAAVPYSPQRSAAVTAATAATANQSQYQRRNHYDAAPASSSSSYEKIHIIPYVDSLPALYQMYAGKKMYSQKYLV